MLANYNPFEREELAAAYDQWYESPLGAFVEAQELAALQRLVERLERNQPIVEVGAGTGRVAAWLAQLGFRVIAVEPASAMRRYGEQRTAGLPVQWVAAHASLLPFPDNSQTAVLMFATLEFVAEPLWALREALRVLQPGGVLLLGILHAHSPWAALYCWLGRRGELPWSYARFYTPEELEQLLGFPPEARAESIYCAPGAQAPYEEADAAGLRAGNPPAMVILQWRKP
ncbi:MAG: class I SAM-dependent methyltransferase [Candidatus Kapabacteria bacterium]|nr:class I SAM-dependent methyltransferase [Candidatus Kapabacteria bacterium]MDW8012336.1 class I SAM-dependent methyltransferase [Bacteroidota bacterium]